MIQTRKPSRPGAAVVELAILLPFLTFMFVIAVDWARIFYYSVTITNCARQGALYGSDPFTAAQSPYASIQEAALADSPNLNPQPTVTSATALTHRAILTSRLR